MGPQDLAEVLQVAVDSGLPGMDAQGRSPLSAAVYADTGLSGLSGLGGGLLANATHLFLRELPTQYGPLYSGLCDWLQELAVPVNVSSCVKDPNSVGLPIEVCEKLANLTAPLNGTLCRLHAPSLDPRDVVRGSCLALLAVLSFVGNCYTIHSIRNKAVSSYPLRRGELISKLEVIRNSS